MTTENANESSDGINSQCELSFYCIYCRYGSYFHMTQAVFFMALHVMISTHKMSPMYTFIYSDLEETLRIFSHF